MSSNTYTRLLWRGDGYSQLPQGQRIGVSCYKEHKFLQALLQLYQSRGIALEQGEPPDLEAEVKQLARSLNLPLAHRPVSSPCPQLSFPCPQLCR